MLPVLAGVNRLRPDVVLKLKATSLWGVVIERLPIAKHGSSGEFPPAVANVAAAIFGEEVRKWIGALA